METKEFSNILTCLSLSNFKLPILSTYFFANNTCQKSFFNNAELMIEKSTLRMGGFITLLISLYKEYEKYTSIKTQNHILCIAYNFNTQKFLSCHNIKSVLEGKETLNSVLCLQKLKIGSKEGLIYCIKLCVSGIKYKYKFFCISKGTFTKCEDTHLKDQAKNISKLVTQALLKQYKTFISNLQIDFYCDSNQKLYIKFIKLSQSPKISEKLNLKPIIISSSDSSQDLSQPSHSKSQKSTLKRCSTLSSRKVFRNNTDNKNLTLKKQLTTIVSKKYESENEESKESLQSDSSESEVDDNFFEIIAREKCKKQFQALGKLGKMTPDNEVLMKEMKIVKKSITSPKLPDIHAAFKVNTEKTRKTLPYIRIPSKNLGIFKNSLTK